MGQPRSRFQTSIIFLLGPVLGVFLSTICDEKNIGGMYALATVTHWFRLIVLNKNVTLFRDWTVADRICFVHFWHDLRTAVKLEGNFSAPYSALGRRKWTVLFTAVDFLFSAFWATMCRLMITACSPVSSFPDGAFRSFFGFGFFYFSMKILDIFYRLPLIFFCGYDVEESVPRRIPLRFGLKYLWGRVWNPVIQDLLKDGVYIPFRKMGFTRMGASGVTFLVSALLHIYPVFLTSASKFDTDNFRTGPFCACWIFFWFFTIQPMLIFGQTVLTKTDKKFSQGINHFNNSFFWETWMFFCVLCLWFGHAVIEVMLNL